ncbi:hypothetical protein C9J85_01650 [Haloferax sp. wsp5]|nr:hypothetical protein C9J85_01650 [Haloferax sp. wsp5]
MEHRAGGETEHDDADRTRNWPSLAGPDESVPGTTTPGITAASVTVTAGGGPVSVSLTTGDRTGVTVSVSAVSP